MRWSAISCTVISVVRSSIFASISIAAYLIGLQHSIETARTMTFAVMIFSQFTMIFSIRSGNGWFTERFFSNRWLWATIVLVMGVSMGVLLLSEFFKLFTRNSHN